MKCSRRSFLKLSAATLPLALGGRAAFAGTDAAESVLLGVQTYSFRDMLTAAGDTTERMIAAMQQLGLTECEMFEPMLQPHALSADAPWRMIAGKPTQASLYGGKRKEAGPNKAELANREDIRRWRLGPGLGEVKAAGEKFRNAGIRVTAFNFSLRDWDTEAEVELAMQMARAMGSNIVSASTTISMARRCVPQFEKHQFLLSLHGHSNAADPNHFASPESFAEALAMSKNYRVNLDIGHFFATGYDPVVYIRENHARITHLHIKDRKKNGGPNMPFGEGDTPIGPVMQLLKKESYPIPAHIEYEYAGREDSVAEVGKCLRYLRSALA
jgi:sugar phosphate isomerase/epimerase